MDEEEVTAKETIVNSRISNIVEDSSSLISKEAEFLCNILS